MSSLPAQLPAEVDTSQYEYVHGRVVERPLPNDVDSDTQFAITSLLKRAISDAKLPLLARSEWTLDSSDARDYEWLTPDVLVTFRTSLVSPRNHALPPALLAIEILSPGQGFLQMYREKVLLYLAWGVDFVWLIDPVERTAMVFRKGKPNGIAVFEGSLEAADVRVSLEEIFRFSETTP